MSLLAEAYEPCIMLNKTKEMDGYGGYVNVWSEGAEFQAAFAFDGSLNAQIAAKQGVSSLYRITTTRALTLDYHDVFKRIRDGKIFRVTTDGDDEYTPKSAGLDMRQVRAEEWSLPND